MAIRGLVGMSPNTRAQCADRNQAKAQLAHPARSTTVACGTSAARSFRISSRIASRCLSKSRRLTLFVKMSAVFFAPGTLVNWLTRLEASAAWIQRHPASKWRIRPHPRLWQTANAAELSVWTSRLNSPYRSKNPDHTQDFSFRSPC